MMPVFLVVLVAVAGLLWILADHRADDADHSERSARLACRQAHPTARAVQPVHVRLLDGDPEGDTHAR